jgi:predicted restriction endonuclease
MVRGVIPPGVAIATDDENLEESGTPDDIQQRAIKIRRGQTKFREKLLSAYGRACAVTGCKIVELLEAAHIQPHAEEPNYSVTNGLLLRADIHTLFDLNLLSVDSRLRIHLAPSLLKSEYKELEGKPLKGPATFSEMPSTFALDKRYQEFQITNKK